MYLIYAVPWRQTSSAVLWRQEYLLRCVSARLHAVPRRQNTTAVLQRQTSCRIMRCLGARILLRSVSAVSII